MNSEGCGRKQPWPTFKWRDLGKPQETSVGMANLWVKSWIQDLQNKRKTC